MTTASAAAAAFRAAVEAGDPHAAAAQLAPDVVFRSPVVHSLYTGREAVEQILVAVTAVFEDFRYTAEYSGPDGHVLQFACRVDRYDLQGVDILKGDGPFRELTVLTRPYSATTALRARMAALLTGPASG